VDISDNDVNAEGKMLAISCRILPSLVTHSPDFSDANV
jgi:hypothetical protein